MGWSKSSLCLPPVSLLFLPFMLETKQVPVTWARGIWPHDHFYFVCVFCFVVRRVSYVVLPSLASAGSDSSPSTS